MVPRSGVADLTPVWTPEASAAGILLPNHGKPSPHWGHPGTEWDAAAPTSAPQPLAMIPPAVPHRTPCTLPTLCRHSPQTWGIVMVPSTKEQEM